MTNAEAWFNIALRPRKPEGSLGRTAQDGHLDSHTAPELFTLPSISDTFKYFLTVRRGWCLMLTAGTNSKLCEQGVSSRRLSWLSRSELSPLLFHWVVVSGSGHCPCDFVPSQLLKEEAVKYKLLYGSDWVMMNWCLMSSDVSWHIRDKLWPMPKHGAINLYVHGNQKAR